MWEVGSAKCEVGKGMQHRFRCYPTNPPLGLDKTSACVQSCILRGGNTERRLQMPYHVTFVFFCLFCISDEEHLTTNPSEALTHTHTHAPYDCQSLTMPLRACISHLKLRLSSHASTAILFNPTTIIGSCQPSSLTEVTTGWISAEFSLFLLSNPRCFLFLHCQYPSSPWQSSLLM